MTDHPEDHNLWPSDPFDLLKIKRSDDARTAKRAYFKLIRKYKPDRFPAEFQKIREAYESVESWLSWQSHVETPEEIEQDEESEQANTTPPVVTHSKNSPLAEEANQTDESERDGNESVYVAEAISDDEPSAPVLTDPIDRFFQSLNSQGLATAVQHLRNIDPSNSPEQSAQANLTKYFINRFLPNSAATTQSPATSTREVTDADQKRIAWLLKTVRSSRGSTAALSELKNEFDLNYRLANCEIVNQYLAKIRDPATLTRLYLLRWEAIGHHQPQTVVTDLQTIQPRALEFGGNRGLWMNLVADSLNYTVWHSQQCAAHNEECWREVSEDSDPWTADSVELLMLASEEWRRMHGSWSTAVPWARSTLPETFRSVWMPIAQEIAADPHGSLESMGGAYREFSMTMALFEEGLRSLSSLAAETESLDQLDWDETRELVGCYFIDVGKTNYASNRVPVMEFCILNQIPLQNFASAAGSFMASEEHLSWTDLIKADGPLRCVVNACHATNY